MAITATAAAEGWTFSPTVPREHSEGPGSAGAFGIPGPRSGLGAGAGIPGPFPYAIPSGTSQPLGCWVLPFVGSTRDSGTSQGSSRCPGARIGAPGPDRLRFASLVPPPVAFGPITSSSVRPATARRHGPGEWPTYNGRVSPTRRRRPDIPTLDEPADAVGTVFADLGDAPGTPPAEPAWMAEASAPGTDEPEPHGMVEAGRRMARERPPKREAALSRRDPRQRSD